MTAKSQLPVPLNDTYFEPSDWQMVYGRLYVSVLTATERAEPRFQNCAFVARTAAGQVKGSFEFVSDALIGLTAQGYAITWQLVRGEQIDVLRCDDDR
jgi:hypothetical protein